MNFEWDENKNLKNIKKHKVDFREAAYVFLDQRAISRLDAANSTDEVRLQIIGLSPKGVLLVAYTEPHGDTIRLVSARKAEKHERMSYERGSF